MGNVLPLVQPIVFSDKLVKLLRPNLLPIILIFLRFHVDVIRQRPCHQYVGLRPAIHATQESPNYRVITVTNISKTFGIHVSSCQQYVKGSAHIDYGLNHVGCLFHVEWSLVFYESRPGNWTVWKNRDNARGCNSYCLIEKLFPIAHW